MAPRQTHFRGLPPLSDTASPQVPFKMGCPIESSESEDFKQKIKDALREEMQALRASHKKIEGLLAKRMPRCLEALTMLEPTSQTHIRMSSNANHASISVDRTSQSKSHTLLEHPRSQCGSTTMKAAVKSNLASSQEPPITDLDTTQQISLTSQDNVQYAQSMCIPDKSGFTMPHAESSRRSTIPGLNSGVDTIGACLCRRVCRNIVFSALFDRCFGTLIILNAISIGAEVQYMTETGSTSLMFSLLSSIFAALFTIELSLRICANNVRDFLGGSERMANVFDFFLVVVSWLEVLNATATAMRFGVFRMIRILRLLRIVRAVRFVPQLRIMLLLLTESVKSLYGLFLVLIAILYVFSIVFTMGAVEYAGLPGDFHHSATQRGVREVSMHYGTMARSAYTLFKSITSGQSWGEVMDPLLEIHPLYVLAFLVYIMFSMLCLLNVATGIAVDAAIAKATTDRVVVAETMLQRKERCICNLKEIFQECDADGSNTLTYDELSTMLDDPRVSAYLQNLQIDLEDMENLFGLMDRDGDGYIDKDEFVESLLHLTRGQSSEQMIQFLLKETQKIFYEVSQLGRSLRNSSIRCSMQRGMSERGVAERCSE